MTATATDQKESKGRWFGPVDGVALEDSAKTDLQGYGKLTRKIILRMILDQLLEPDNQGGAFRKLPELTLGGYEWSVVVLGNLAAIFREAESGEVMGGQASTRIVLRVVKKKQLTECVAALNA